jgi:hypothetical protein
VVKPVFYEVGVPRARATRRVGTNMLRVIMTAGTTPESVLGTAAASAVPVPDRAGEYMLQAPSTLAALELTTTLGTRAGVTSVALSAVPERVLRKQGSFGRRRGRSTTRRRVLRAQAPAGREGRGPRRAVSGGIAHMKLMPAVHPDGDPLRRRRRPVTRRAPPSLGADPSRSRNIGGRTRAIVIDPNGTTMCRVGSPAAWKSTNGGASWSPAISSPTSP